MAHRDKVKKDGRVWEISQIEVHPEYKDADYRLDSVNEQTMGETGAWKLFTITHCSGFPQFRGRWDEKKSMLDIDRFDSPDGKPEKNFTGHRTCQPSSTFREFEVHIRWPEVKTIFKGRVSFSISREFVSEGGGAKAGGCAITSFVSSNLESEGQDS
jgi:hypothetical protein